MHFVYKATMRVATTIGLLLALLLAMLAIFYNIAMYVIPIIEEILGPGLGEPLPYQAEAYFGAVFGAPAMGYLVALLWHHTWVDLNESEFNFHPYALAYVLIFALPALLGWTWWSYWLGIALALIFGHILAYWLKTRSYSF